MTPTLEVLTQRDLEEPARRIAREFGLTLEAMFGGRQLPAPNARARFYWHLRDMGWSDAAIGRFVGKDRKCVADATRKHPKL